MRLKQIKELFDSQPHGIKEVKKGIKTKKVKVGKVFLKIVMTKEEFLKDYYVSKEREAKLPDTMEVVKMINRIYLKALKPFVHVGNIEGSGFPIFHTKAAHKLLS